MLSTFFGFRCQPAPLQRGLIGYRAQFVGDTHGTGTLQRAFHGYGEYRGAMDRVRKGVLISTATGLATLKALGDLEPRGTLFVTPHTEVYEVSPVQARPWLESKPVFKFFIVK